VRCGGLSIALSLDEKSLGLCPVESLRVAPGDHTLKGWPVEGRRYFSTYFSRKVTVSAGLETVVDISELRWVRLESEPFGAMVTRGGIPIGRTPVTISVTPGDPPVLVEKEGYRVAPVSAESLLSGPSTRRIPLEPAPGRQAATALGMPSPVKQTRFGYKTVLLGMSVLGSATAAVALSKEADESFEEYKTAGDLGRMNELFDKAESLDNWSVGFWIASEVALGLLIYHLLHDRGPSEDGPAAEPTPSGHSGGGR
jgi:hypothetical protein